MKFDEVIISLHRIFTGKDGVKDSRLEEFEKLSPEDAYNLASNHHEQCLIGQRNCLSDWGYWAWKSDITIYHTLMRLFKLRMNHGDDANYIPPPLPMVLDKQVLMDRLSDINHWISRCDDAFNNEKS